MSSKYTTTKELVKDLKISSIILMKVVGEFFKPKDMMSHSKRHYFDLEVIFHTFFGSIEI
jgi:hypothetical protein